MNLPNGYLLQHGKYKLTQVVGQGGFGITYKGIWYTDVRGALGAVRTEVPVCIKEFFFKDYCARDPQTRQVTVYSETGQKLFGKFREKLLKEARILSEVHHPYIVNVLEVFEENNTAYIVMEYIPGQSLKERLERVGVLPEGEVLRYVRQIGEALQFVHEKHILHLDIKPSNILLDQEDNARLIDFGVSKRYDIDQQETSTTMLTLSKGFASIEQYDDEGTQVFSPCPDIYSLGATMYNLLTGKIPTESILRAARSMPLPRELNPQIRPSTEAVILKAMEILPARRYQSVREMLEALDFSLPDEPVGTSASLPGGNPEDEETQVFPPSESDGEETQLLNSQLETVRNPEISQTRSFRKFRFHVWLLVLLGLFLLWMGFRRLYQKPEAPVVTDLKAEVPDTLAQLAERDSVLPEKKSVVSSGMSSVSGRTSRVSTVKSDVRKEPLARPEVKPEKAVQEPSQPADSLSVDVDRIYSDRLASGKGRMKAEDYQGAKADFQSAKQVKLTEEVVRLLITCDEKIEQQQKQERIAQYEKKMNFGAYTIVRRKSSGRYGAIDADGQEKIPCRYLSVGIADKGRAFERTDNLFDIYDVKGNLIHEGVAYY